jgi:hypothetical protein
VVVWAQATFDALDGDVGIVRVVEGWFGDVSEHLVAAAVRRHDRQRKCGHPPEGCFLNDGPCMQVQRLRGRG